MLIECNFNKCWVRKNQVSPAGKYCIVENLNLLIYVLTPHNYTGKQPPETEIRPHTAAVKKNCNNIKQPNNQKKNLDFYILKKVWLILFMYLCKCLYLYKFLFIYLYIPYLFIYKYNLLCIYTCIALLAVASKQLHWKSYYVIWL